MIPPYAVGYAAYANGISQSIARCIGPVDGGYVSRSGIYLFIPILKQTVRARYGLSALQIVRWDITLVLLFGAVVCALSFP